MTGKKIPWLDVLGIGGAFIAIGLVVGHNLLLGKRQELLNVSYDPTRELYKEVNTAFVADYEKQTGKRLAILQSHGGSSRQASLVVHEESKANVVTLGLPSDIDLLRQRGLVGADWQERLPNHARPYFSTIVFVVRKGNPQHIQDWPDLVKPGVEVITPDPENSGNGKLVALSAWGSVTLRGGTPEEAQRYLKSLYEHAPFLLPASRMAGLAFTQEKVGDVHLAWENEAIREVGESKGELQVVYPPISILAEPSVAWVDANTQDPAERALAKAYLTYLFSDAGQELMAKNGYRPYKADIFARHTAQFPNIKLFEITAIAQGWSDAQNKFFSDNGIVNAFYTPKPR